MTQERRIDRTPELWAELAGRTIIAAGPDGSGRQEFVQNLAHLAGLQKTEIHIGDRPETAAGEDFVILFAGTLSKISDSLESLSNADFAAAVVITDYSVFGKCFGRERTLREEELGYVCHTSAAEQPQFGMRLAEQLACRMAREDGVNIKVARIPCAARSGDIQTGRTPGTGQSGDSRKRLIEAVLYVLLHGKAGEIYSLPDMQDSPADAGQNYQDSSAAGEQNCRFSPTEEEQHSPLSPIKNRPDTQKFEKLIGNR